MADALKSFEEITGTVKTHQTVPILNGSDDFTTNIFRENQPGFIFGLGFRVPIYRFLDLKVEVNELVIQIKPFDGWANAGGARVLAGLVLRFNVKRGGG